MQLYFSIKLPPLQWQFRVNFSLLMSYSYPEWKKKNQIAMNNFYRFFFLYTLPLAIVF